MSNMAAATCNSHDLHSVTVTLQRLLEHARPVVETEAMPLEQADGRVLARPLVATMDIPPTDTSAMDGYAVRSTDVTGNETRLSIRQRIAAGNTGSALQPATAARIFTGAALPMSADAVVMQENVWHDGATILIAGPVSAGQNVRRRGSLVRSGSTVLPAGTRLRPQHLALAASLGLAAVTVFRRLRVALLSNGNELQPPGAPLLPGHTYNANPYALRALLSRLGCETEDLGILADDRDLLRRQLAQAAGRSDLILSSGGMSVGEEDHMRNVVAELGEIALWRVRIKPGKPFAFGRIGSANFLGLPGNPVSALVSFGLFARPFLLACQGQAITPAIVYTLRADFDRHFPQDRDAYLAAHLVSGTDGTYMIRLHSNQDSAALTALAETDGLAIIPAGCTVRAGDLINFMPFSDLFSA